MIQRIKKDGDSWKVVQVLTIKEGKLVAKQEG